MYAPEALCVSVTLSNTQTVDVLRKPGCCPIVKHSVTPALERCYINKRIVFIIIPRWRPVRSYESCSLGAEKASVGFLMPPQFWVHTELESCMHGEA